MRSHRRSHAQRGRQSSGLVEARTRAMAIGVVQVLVPHADAPGECERARDVSHLLASVTVGAERESNAGGVSPSHETFVHGIPIRELEHDARVGKCTYGALFELLGPPLLEGD